MATIENTLIFGDRPTLEDYAETWKTAISASAECPQLAKADLASVQVKVSFATNNLQLPFYLDPDAVYGLATCV